MLGAKVNKIGIESCNKLAKCIASSRLKEIAHLDLILDLF